MNKYIILSLSFIFLCISCTREVISDIPDENNPQAILPDYRNFYGIVWVGNNDDNLAFAKQMGYDYIFYNNGIANHANSDSLKFYLESPQYDCYQRRVDRSISYTEKEKDDLSRFVALKDASKPFPENLARGWFFTPDLFSTEPDWQQQRVIDLVVDSILRRVASLERKEKGFEFGGFAWDVPQFYGDFWDSISSRNGRQVTLAYWTGHDSGDKHPDVTHEYETYSDGYAAFYKTLWRRTRQKYPNARFIVEPWHPYNEYLRHIVNRPDFHEIIPDLIVQEMDGDEFATDENVINSGLIDPSKLGCTTPNIFTEEANRKIAGLAASRGSVFGWYGRFGGTGDMPAYNNITEVPARLQLVRVIAGWENLHQTPLNERKWDGETYSSPKAHISKDVIYAIQPRTNRLFIVFLTANASIEIPSSHISASIYSTDNLFCEVGINATDIRITNNKITLLNQSKAGAGFILK